MKIAIFTDLYAPWVIGGIVSSIQAQKAELEKMGHEVVIFCPGLNAAGRKAEKDVITVPSHQYLKINGAILTKRPTVVEKFILEKMPNFAEFDLVHVHYEASCSLAGIRLARRFGMPLAQTMHGREDMAIAINVPHPFKTLVALILNCAHGHYLPHRLQVKRDDFQAPTVARQKMWNLMANQAEMADVVMAPSRHFAKKLEYYGVTKPLMVVSNGLPEALVAQKFPMRQLQPGDVLKMVWNSRLSNEKRIMPFLKALALLKRPYLLHVYGDGNCTKKAQNYAKKHQLKVKFYGRQNREKIIERMQEAHLAVMASYNFDTQGMTLLEAEATGLPVFFCDPAMQEVVPEGSFVLANGPEPAAMAIALDQLEAEKIALMSSVMLAHRQETLEKVQIENLLDAYAVALLKRPL